MKSEPLYLSLFTGVFTFVAAAAASAAPIVLPASTALPPGSGVDQGFRVRTVQGPDVPEQPASLPNSFSRAVRQLNGTLLDAGGMPVPNEAIPGPNADGSYNMFAASFDRDGSPVLTFSATNFPGIPGSNSHTRSFAVEAVAYLELMPGTYTLGMAVSADRTDVNDDDGYVVYSGENARSFFATEVGAYERFAAPFVSNQRNTNYFQVTAPVAGLYPFRILYWQTDRSANLNFFSISDTNTGAAVLINDPDFPFDSIVAYRSVRNAPRATGPYVSEVNPLPGSSGIRASEAITLQLVDGETALNDASVRLYLNDTRVTPQSIARAGNRLNIRYDPSTTRTETLNRMRVEFADTAGISTTNRWQFSIVTGGSVGTRVAGQWDFDAGDLRATVGTALQYFDPNYDGPTGSAATKTEFGTTTSFGISDIDGMPARVMKVPGELDRRIGYVMTHGIAPNGGGTRVNQYTLIMDVYVETSGPGAASLLQISSLNNTDDGDLFWQGSNFGQGGGGYNGTGLFRAGEWHRIVAAYDEAATPPVVTKYVDGVKQDDWTANQGLDNPRRALQPTALLFADGDVPNVDERRVMYVNSVQIRSGKLTDAEMVILGGPKAKGIPQEIPREEVAGQWDFDRGDLSATIGRALQYFDPAYDGPTGSAATKTEFGTTTSFGIPDINGAPANVMKVPGELDRRIGYIMTHGIAPNGGGTRVNQYTLIMDVYVETSGPGAASLLQISSLNNTDDGDLFWQGSNFGQGGGGYNGTGLFRAGEWHRIVAAYDEAATPPVVTKYVDGVKQDDWTANQGLDNPRRALQPTAILFADGDVPNVDERRVMYVNSVQIRPRKLSDAEMVALGGPSAGGVTVDIPATTATGQWDFDRGDLSATIGRALQYFDATYDGPTGSATTKTEFGTTTSFGIPDINGLPANVMKVPGELERRIGYVMTHGIAPNGGGTRVNQYTLIMDIYVETSGPGAASLLQISSLNNTDDGDLFWQGNNFGQGGGGYNGTGLFRAGEWHRIVAAYDEAATPPVVTKYVDGVKQDDWTANQGLDNPRRALQPTAILFADGDVPNVDERRVMYVNSVQIRSGKLTDAEMVSLGGPSATGIPAAIPTSSVSGQWDFDRGDLSATIGRALQYFDATYDGPTGSATTKTEFGTTTSFGIADINGVSANVMKVPGELERRLGYIMTHGIAPNGGGTRVNRYTLIMDIYVEASGPGAASLLQISSLNNTDDGDLFWQGSNFGQGGGGYVGTGIFRAGEWHRIAAAYDEAATPPVVVKYVDGIFQDNWTANQGLDNPRRALQPTALLFADGDVPNVDERRVMYVNSIQIRPEPLNMCDLELLGGPQAGGIPVVIKAAQVAPKLFIRRDGANVVVTWQKPAGDWVLESAPRVTGGWTEVLNVVGTTFTVPIEAVGNLFFRLRSGPPPAAAR